LALAIAAMAWLPSPVLAQEKGAQKLMKIQTVEDLQTVEAGDTIVMSCPKCKDTYTQVVEKSYKAATPDELKTVTTHLCSSCDTKIVTKGVGKNAKDTLVHTCNMCGSGDVSCCVIKKGNAPTTGMEKM
jgi:Fe-S oxidoreductase